MRGGETERRRRKTGREGRKEGGRKGVGKEGGRKRGGKGKKGRKGGRGKAGGREKGRERGCVSTTLADESVKYFI